MEMRRVLNASLQPIQDEFIAKAETLGFSSAEASSDPINLHMAIACPLKPYDNAFVFDVYASVMALVFELVAEYGVRAHEYAALPLLSLIHISEPTRR